MNINITSAMQYRSCLKNVKKPWALYGIFHLQCTWVRENLDYAVTQCNQHAGLEISEFASPNANQFQAKCESLPLNDLPCVRIKVVLHTIHCTSIFRCTMTRRSFNNFIQQF